jgi:hypothetical protein
MGGIMLFVKISAWVILFAALYPIAKAGVGFECAVAMIAMEIISWPKNKMEK